MRSAIVTLGLIVAAEAAADECLPTAVLEGDAALVDALDGALQRRGIATRASTGCPAASVRIDRQGSHLFLGIVDPAGRRSQRALADVDAAASWIESWARQDMNASLLLGFVVPDAPAPAAEASVARDAPAPRSTRTRDRFSLVASAETSRAFEGSAWLGARAHGCVRVGPICAGATGRILASDGARSIDVLGGLDVPIALSSRSAIVVGAAAGAGWFSSSYTRGEAMMTSMTAGLRLDAHAAFAYVLGRHVAVHVGIAVGGSPSAPVTLDATADMPLTNNEPRGFVRADAGLRIGVP